MAGCQNPGLRVEEGLRSLRLRVYGLGLWA